MKIRNTVDKSRHLIINIYGKVLTAIGLLSLTQAAIADGIIPISTNDQTDGGSDFAQTMIKIFQTDIIPFIMIAGAVWLIWTGISTMSNGIKEAQEKQKFDPLKNAIIKTIIVVVVGGGLLYLMDKVRTYQFNG